MPLAAAELVEVLRRNFLLEPARLNQLDELLRAHPADGDCRSAKRSLRDQDSRSPYVGFRVVCEP